MARKSDKKSGYGKLLDVWMMPDGAGDPVGCIATTFTFSPAFYEEECLGRFLRLENDPIRDGALYLIEREEKLSQVVCAGVLVDQHHCKGTRSLRWDLLPARSSVGLLHAKIVLLYWTNWLRLVISSANITENGYRLNQEVFGVLDYMPGGNAPIACLAGTVRFLKNVLDQSIPDAEKNSPAIDRWRDLLDRVNAISPDWGSAVNSNRIGAMRVYPVFSGAGEPTVFDSMKETWPSNSPPYEARIYSPFFNPPEADNRPAEEIWGFIRQRGSARCKYYVIANEVEGEPRIYVQAPESIMTSQPQSRSDVKTEMHRLELDADRPFHAKGMWFENDRWTSYLIGSSNFTSAGLGIGKQPNLEANLAYILDRNKAKSGHKKLQEAFPSGSRIDRDLEIVWQSESTLGEDDIRESVVLPKAFGGAVYHGLEGEKGRVVFSINDDAPPDWKILKEDGDRIYVKENDWVREGRPETFECAWDEDRPPSGFYVRWKDSPAAAWWPVNIHSQASLPPPEELKNIPLEVLIEILTSSRPVHQVLKKYFRRKHDDEPPVFENPALNPHKRVDTSNFIIQRTRKISYALANLRVRLEQPVSNEKCLWWRLRGPVGVIALARALVEDTERQTSGYSYSNKEEVKAFLLSEIALELSRVKPIKTQGYLGPEVVQAELKNVITDLKDLAGDISIKQNSPMSQYIKSVFEAAAS